MASPLFYTIKVNNTTGIVQPLVFDVNISRPFIQKPSDYYVSVVRFKLPNYNTPLFHFIDGAYLMTMSYNSVSTTLPVIYIPQNSIVGGRAVYEVQGFIEMLNTTIGSLYTALNGLVTLPTSNMPYFTYDEETELMTFTANKQYFLTSAALPIQIQVNQALYQMISGFPTYYNDVTDKFLLWVKDYYDNTVTIGGVNYIQMVQQNSSIPQIIDFGGIILTSNMPISNEYIGSTYINPSYSTQAGLQEVVLPILQDYVPTDFDMSTFWQNLVYNAIVPYRQCALISDQPFSNIRIDAYVSNNSGTMSRMNISPNGSASIKLMFTKKTESKYA